MINSKTLNTYPLFLVFFFPQLACNEEDNLSPTVDHIETMTESQAVFQDDGKLELRLSFVNNSNSLELNDDRHFISVDQNPIRFDNSESEDVLEFQLQ